MRNFIIFSGIILVAISMLLLVHPQDSAADEGDCVELVINGNMESVYGWSFPATSAQGGYDTAQYLSPVRSARLGIVSAANTYSFSSMRQPVDIPQGDQLVLSWHMYPLSEPFDGQDLQYVSILMAELPQTELRRVWSGVRDDADWVSCSYDISEFLERDIILNLTVRNDGEGGTTAMHVDDVSMKVCQAPQDTLEGCLVGTVTPTPSPTPTQTPTPTLSPTPTVTPTPASPACEQLVTNPDFDQGDDGYAGWEQNLFLTAEYEDLDGASHRGAWFGGAQFIDQYLYQDISIPADASSATLSYLWALNPPAPDAPLAGSEALTITLRSPDDTVLSTLMVIGEGSERHYWRQASFDLSPYTGQTLRLHAQARTDETTTSWYLDQVNLRACIYGEKVYLPLMLTPG